MKRRFRYWEQRGFCFDDVDRDSACLPYEPARLVFRGLACRDLREVRVVGAVVDIPHAEDPEHDPADCFFRRLQYLERPSARGWRRWVASRPAVVRMIDRLVRFFESRPGGGLAPDLILRVNGASLGCCRPGARAGAFELACPLKRPGDRLDIELSLAGCAGDVPARLGRWLSAWPLPQALWIRLQKHRYRYFRYRQVRVRAVELDGAPVVRFSGRSVELERTVIHRLWRPGINLVGYFDHQTGIGESVRCAARAAAAVQLPVSCVQLKCGTLVRDRDTEFDGRLADANPHRVNVFHIPIPQSADVDRAHGPGFRRGRYNVGYWAWELESLPSGWVSLYRVFDEIWAPSRFVADAVAAEVPLPVLVMPHAIDFRIPEGRFRQRFGLPEDLFLFLFVFDLSSLSARKNPEAAIRAFRRAFPGPSARAGLVIKTHGAAANPEEFARLAAWVQETPNGFLIPESLSREEVLRLQKSCDCFVSLHRSEGFGLSVAEAMYMGKPVISTDWSATAEYVTAQNGCPVPAERVMLTEHHDVFPKGAVWAEPDVDYAAACMRRLAAEPGWGAALGERAAADIRRRFSARAVGERYRRRLEAIFQW